MKHFCLGFEPASSREINRFGSGMEWILKRLSLWHRVYYLLNYTICDSSSYDKSLSLIFSGWAEVPIFSQPTKIASTETN